MCNYAGTFKVICSYNLVYNFLIYIFPLQSSASVVHVSKAVWHGNIAFPKGSPQNDIAPLLVIYHLSYSKYKVEKKCFHSCRYETQNFSLVWHSCRSCSTRVALSSFMQHWCCTGIAFVLHSFCLCLIHVALVLHLCHSCLALVL